MLTCLWSYKPDSLKRNPQCTVCCYWFKIIKLQTCLFLSFFLFWIMSSTPFILFTLVLDTNAYYLITLKIRNKRLLICRSTSFIRWAGTLWFFIGFGILDQMLLICSILIIGYLDSIRYAYWLLNFLNFLAFGILDQDMNRQIGNGKWHSATKKKTKRTHVINLN